MYNEVDIEVLTGFGQAGMPDSVRWWGDSRTLPPGAPEPKPRMRVYEIWWDEHLPAAPPPRRPLAVGRWPIAVGRLPLPSAR